MDAALFIGLILFLLLFLAVVVVGIVTAIGAAIGSTPRLTSLDFNLPEEPAPTLERLHEQITPVMHEAKYQATERSSSALRYSRAYHPAWTIVLAVLLFPIGLVFLLIKSEDELIFNVGALDQGSRVTVSGKVGRKTRERVVELLSREGEQQSPAGWYEEEPGRERYWDGQAWTDQHRPSGAEPVVFGPRMKKRQRGSS
jgi:hypothetical protein